LLKWPSHADWDGGRDRQRGRKGGREEGRKGGRETGGVEKGGLDGTTHIVDELNPASRRRFPLASAGLDVFVNREPFRAALEGSVECENFASEQRTVSWPFRLVAGDVAATRRQDFGGRCKQVERSSLSRRKSLGQGSLKQWCVRP
jgi:hypothetical protein